MELCTLGMYVCMLAARVSGSVECMYGKVRYL